MSIANLLEPNSFNLYCNSLNVNTTGSVPGMYIVTHPVPLYNVSNSVATQIATLNCTFVRITNGTQPGLCYVNIPDYTYINDTYQSYFYLDISAFTDVSMINNLTLMPYSIIDDNDYNIGSIACNGANQHIEIYASAQYGSQFAAGPNASGFNKAGYVIYQQTFLS